MDEKAALIRSINQLIEGCTPYVGDVHSADQVKNCYLHMEENNKDFHKYSFVKTLQSDIEKVLGPMIEAEIERYGGERTHPAAKHENLVASITSRILKSSEYSEMSERIRNKVSGACNYILENFQKDPFVSGKESTGSECPVTKEFCRRDRPTGAEPVYSDAESSIGDTSLNRSAVLFMNADQQKQAAHNLDRQNDIDTRKQAINELLQVTSFDTQNCAIWPVIRAGLIDALADDDEDLSSKSLHFIARGLSSNSACSREMYVVLVEFLDSQWKSQRPPKYIVAKEGLDIKQPYVKKLLRCFRLLNTFQQLVPHYWQRYPDGCLDKLLRPTMSLLAKYSTGINPIMSGFTPLHFLALVDWKAKWFINTMHGHSGRSPLLQILEAEEHRDFASSAVMSCLNFVSSSVMSAEHVGRCPDTTDRSKVFYSEHEVKFAHFLHCLCILRRLIVYEQGRKFFPIKYNGKESASLTQLLEALLQFVTHGSRLCHHRCTLDDELNPCLLIIDMMKKLCTSEDVCRNTLCKDKLINVLMTPITVWLAKSRGVGGSGKVSEVVLAHVAEILSSIASKRCGQQLLLYGEDCNWQSPVARHSTPVHLLAEFAQKALSDDVLPRQVVGSLVFVCRQLYSTCEGLLQLSHHRLHHSLTDAWKAANREGDCATPTPTIERSQAELPKADLWEDVLQDDLLNFAATPKGVLLLQQTGAMCECVSYMYLRYERKLQVSSCEKFGYGFMMSQVSATAAGIAAMDKTGFTCALIRALWNSVETLDESASSVPRFWPVSAIEKVAKKPFTNIVNLLSSFRSVFEVIGLQNVPAQKKEYSHRHGPATVIDLLDRLTFVDTTAKIQSLFNYEYSHTFGLRLLSVMTSCLDTALLLQNKYKFQEMLLQSQAGNVQPGNGIILDMLSLERNYILVKTFLVGGPSERKLPPRTLQNGQHEFPYELFFSYPVPRMYTVDQVSNVSRDDSSTLAKFPSSVDLRLSWLDKTSKLLAQELTRQKDGLSLNVCMHLMQCAVEVRCQYSPESVFPNISSSESYGSVMRNDISPLQLLGASVTVRYGCYLKLLTNQSEAKDSLCQLLKKCCHSLKQQQFSPTQSEFSCVRKDSEVGFDWFLATIFLMTSGNADRTYNLLSSFSSLLSSAFVWTQRTHCSKHLPQSFVLSGILPLYAVTCHNVELILQLELPHIHSVFRMSGCSPAQICQQWLNQCFWNYLDWPQIYQYVMICIVFGADYQVYMCIAILRHLQCDLMRQMQDKNLLIYLKEEPIRHFRISDHFEYMQQLEKKFRDTVVADMRRLLKEP